VECLDIRMKTTIRTVSLPVIALMFCIFVGCAAFPHHRLPEIGQLPQPAERSQAVEAVYQLKSGVDSGDGRAEHLFRREFEEIFADTLKESGYFASLLPGNEGSIVIEADMLNYWDKNAALVGGIVAGLSLTIIPGWVTDNFTLTVKVTSSQGKHAEYVLDDAMTMVIWLPMIVINPHFKRPWETKGHDLLKNMYKNLILRMQQDGFLPPAKKISGQFYVEGMTKGS
jgi:hypothetical protein